MFRKAISRLTGKTYKPKYSIEKEVYAAAFSNIYEARERRSGRRLIIKILNEAGEKMARRIDRHANAKWEGELMRGLDHPNIPKTFDCGSGKKFWIAMEYLEYPLYSYISKGPENRRESELIDIFHDIASALNYLHKRGMIHRDIAPDNIMLKDHTAKLIDFGMTIPIGLNVAGGKVGTPSYMPPEMIRKMDSSPAGDIYSLGIVMYEVVTGVKLFGGNLKEERMTRVLNVHPLSPSELEKACSHELEELIMSCVSKDPPERPSDAGEIVRELEIIQSRQKLEEV